MGLPASDAQDKAIIAVCLQVPYSRGENHRYICEEHMAVGPHPFSPL